MEKIVFASDNTLDWYLNKLQKNKWWWVAFPLVLIILGVLYFVGASVFTGLLVKDKSDRIRGKTKNREKEIQDALIDKQSQLDNLDSREDNIDEINIALNEEANKTLREESDKSIDEVIKSHNEGKYTE